VQRPSDSGGDLEITAASLSDPLESRYTLVAVGPIASSRIQIPMPMPAASARARAQALSTAAGGAGGDRGRIRIQLAAL
jgi:hypothetical protein